MEVYCIGGSPCSGKEAAFANWMERDARFAAEVRRQCMQLGLPHLLTDGTASPEDRLQEVTALFRLNAPLCQERP